MPDRYTKFVLTVIAISLAIIAARGLPLLKVASAAAPAHVIVDKVDNWAFQNVTVPLPVKIYQ